MSDSRETADVEPIRSVNPANLEVNDEIQPTPPEEVDEAVERARQAQEEWARTSFSARNELLDVLQDHLIRRREETVQVVSDETGKPRGEAMVTDLIPVIDAARYLREHGEDVLEEELPLDNVLVRDRRSKIVRQPVGVLGMITPWNYPLGIPGSQVLYAVYAGNAVVLKPAQQTTLTGLKIQELLEDAGLP
ncbi:MAG: aldehyde dehydrogenase family protein, partial [Halobacteriota archaeon]